VRVQLGHRVAAVRLDRDHTSVQGDALGLTQQEDHRHAVTHFQDGFLLSRNMTVNVRWVLSGSSSSVSARGTKWYAGTTINERTLGRKFAIAPAGSRTVLADIDDREDWS